MKRTLALALFVLTACPAAAQVSVTVPDDLDARQDWLEREWSFLAAEENKFLMTTQPNAEELANLNFNNSWPKNKIIFRTASWLEFGHVLVISYTDNEGLNWIDTIVRVGPGKFEGVRRGPQSEYSFQASFRNTGYDAQKLPVLVVSFSKPGCEKISNETFISNFGGGLRASWVVHCGRYSTGVEEVYYAVSDEHRRLAVASLARQDANLTRIRQEGERAEAERREENKAWARDQQRQVDEIYQEGSARVAEILSSDTAAAEVRDIERTYRQRERSSEWQAGEEARLSPQASAGPSSGERIVAQEQARAEQLRQEREVRATEERRVADAEAGARRQREEQARRDAEAARTRPVEWIEGVVLCEPRANSKQWRCMGPLQTNVLELDAPNTLAQLALACGGDSGIREIGSTGGYRAYGCGFGIHPTASNYPGNRDVPRDLGVFVSDRRVFRCPPTRDAYCRTP